MKPDLVAPGANVLSAQPSNVCGSNCWAFYNGTSMATPHLAGAAAAVKSKHLTWSPAEIRSAITNTANPHVLSSYTGVPGIDDPNIVGTGLLDVTRSIDATVTIDPVSVSFGTIPSGSGQTRTVNVSITNRGTSAVAVSVSSEKVGAATFSVPATTIGAGQTAVVPVKVTVAKGAAAGPSWSRLNVGPAGGHPVAQARLFVLIG